MLGFGVCIADAFPQTFQDIGPGLGVETFIGTEALHHSLDHLFLNAVGAGFSLPKIKHFCQPADDGGIGVSVPVFKTEVISKFLQ